MEKPISRDFVIKYLTTTNFCYGSYLLAVLEAYNSVPNFLLMEAFLYKNAKSIDHLASLRWLFTSNDDVVASSGSARVESNGHKDIVYKGFAKKAGFYDF